MDDDESIPESIIDAWIKDDCPDCEKPMILENWADGAWKVYCLCGHQHDGSEMRDELRPATAHLFKPGADGVIYDQDAEVKPVDYDKLWTDFIQEIYNEGKYMGGND